jgi:hypothetical protein
MDHDTATKQGTAAAAQKGDILLIILCFDDSASDLKSGKKI